MSRCGIYRITCTANGKFYIGSSKNYNKRISKHKSQLKFNRHENVLMQRSYNKYSVDTFVYEFIEEVKIDKLLLVEQIYLDMNPPFNIGKKASGGDNLTNHPKRDEIIKKIKQTQRNIIDSMSEQDRKNKWGRLYDANPNWRGGSSKKYCECGNTMGYNSNQCIKCYNKLGETNPFYGMKHSEDTKNAIRKTHTDFFNNSTPEERAKRNPQIRKVLIDGNLYIGVSEASRQLGVCPATICHRIKSQNPKYREYYYAD